MTELKTLGERLNYAMKERGIGQRDLAIHSGISQANISKICTEKSKKTTFISELSVALGVNPHWLASGVGDIWVEEKADWAKERLAQLVGYKANPETETYLISKSKELSDLTPGHSSIAPASAIESLVIRRAQTFKFAGTETPSTLTLGVFYGDLMSPTINDGDVVVVDKAVRAFNTDGIYAFEIHSQLHICRIQRRASGDIAIIPDNQRYTADVISRDMLDDVLIHGAIKSVVSVDRV